MTQKRRQAYQNLFLPIAQTLSICDVSNRALREMLFVCHQKGIPTALLYMPEDSDFSRWYPPRVKEQINTYLTGLSKEFAVPLIDARGWLPASLFSDYVHLLPAGSTEFTARLQHETIPRLLQDSVAAHRYARN
jgi:hypothetical protein